MYISIRLKRDNDRHSADQMYQKYHLLTVYLFCTVLSCSWRQSTYQNAEPASEEDPVLCPVGLGARLLMVLVVVVLRVVVVRLVIRWVGIRLLVYNHLLCRVLCRRYRRKRVA